MQTIHNKRIQRKTRVRKHIVGTTERPRLTVFRSNKRLYVQIIDDKTGRTLVAAAQKDPGAGMEKAKTLGMDIAKKAQEKKITAIVFDKGSYAYHGKIKALADGAREGGLQF